MFPGLRQFRIALKTLAVQKAGNLASSQVHPLRIRTFTSTPHFQAAQTPDIKDSSLFQQLATNPTALLAINEFRQLMKTHGIEFSADRPPSTMQLFKLMANSEFRNGVQKLRDDLEKAGVNVNPEDAMQMLEAFKLNEPNTK